MKSDKPRRQSTRKKSLVKPKKKKEKKNFSREDQLSRLELYEKQDANNPLNQKLRPFEGFNGPKQERHMTDKICLPVFVILFVALILHAIILITYGDRNRLTNGFDFRGELCGTKGLVHLPYLYYGSPSKDLNVVFCVDKCPTSTGRKICMYDIDHFTTTPFCYVQMSSDQVGRMCLPQEPINRAAVDESSNEPVQQVRRLLSDLYLSWDLVFISIILISCGAYLLTYLLTVPSVVLYQIWAAVWGSLICFGMLAWMFWQEYRRVIEIRCLFDIDKHDCGGQRAMVFQYLCLITSLIGVGYLIYVMKLFNRINLGIGLIQASAKAMNVLSQLRFFAIFQAAVGILVTFLVYVMAIYGLTIGEVKTILGYDIDGNLLKKYYPNLLAQYTLGLPAFMIVFVLYLLYYVNEMFNSYALSVWFFTKKKAVVKIPLHIVLKELLVHHLGTCIYMTFVQLLFFLPKLIMHYVHLFLWSLPQASLIVRFMQGCCLCCLAAHQYCLRYISKHAMVQVAIWSDPYGLASEKAYFILHRNQDTVRDLDMLVEFILFQLKLCNSLFLSLPIYFYLSYAKTTPAGTSVSDIESPLVPTLLVFMCGFFYTSIFQGVYDIASKSIIQLYLTDREMFYAEQRYVEDFIEKFMNFYGTKEEEKIQLKSHKQLKYTAKIAPEESVKDEEEEESEDDDDELNIDMDDDEDEEEEVESDEPSGSHQASDDHDHHDHLESQMGHSAVAINVRPKMAKVTDADPFELGDDGKKEDE